MQRVLGHTQEEEILLQEEEALDFIRLAFSEPASSMHDRRC